MDNREDVLAQKMREACSGNSAQYRSLLASITPMIRGIVNAKLSGMSEVDREDVLQEVLMAIHMKRDTWRQDQPIRPWIFAITRYKIIDLLRKKGRAQTVDIDEFSDVLAADEVDPSAQMDLDSLVDKLKGKQAVVVKAIAFEGLSHSDVAERLGIKETAVRVNFHRGLEKLRALGKMMKD